MSKEPSDATSLGMTPDTVSDSPRIYKKPVRSGFCAVLVSGDVPEDRRVYMSSSVSAAAAVDTAVERAQSHLLACQSPDGHWVGELEANSTISSEYLLFTRLLDRIDREREQKIVTYLRRQQLPD